MKIYFVPIPLNRKKMIISKLNINVTTYTLEKKFEFVDTSFHYIKVGSDNMNNLKRS